MKNLAPPAAYVALDETYRTVQWTRMLGPPGSDDLWLVRESGGEIIGIGGACAPTHRAFAQRGEIRFLHLDPAYQRRGLGRQLLSRLAGYVVRRSYCGVALSVVEGNTSARAFYRVLGGREIGFIPFPARYGPPATSSLPGMTSRCFRWPPRLSLSSSARLGLAAAE